METGSQIKHILFSWVGSVALNTLTTRLNSTENVQNWKKLANQLDSSTFPDVPCHVSGHPVLWMYQISSSGWPDIQPFFYYPVPDPAKMLEGTGYCNLIFYLLTRQYICHY